MRGRPGLVLVAGLAVAGVAVLGGAAGAWGLRGFALAVLLAGAMAALSVPVARAAARSGARPARLPPHWAAFGAGAVATALACLNLVERLDGQGGPFGLALSLVLAEASTVLLAASAGLPGIGPWRPRLRDVPALVALAGGCLILAGVGLGLAIGARAMGQATAFAVATAALAVVAVLARVPPGATLPGATGRGAARTAAALALASGALTWQLVGTFGRSNFGPADEAFLALHVAGLALIGVASLAGFRPARAP